MTENNANTATYESKSEAVQDEKDLVKLWLDQIARSDADEKAWRLDAEEAEDTYRAKTGAKNLSFNIFHANIETIVPSLYNSTPIPDVRRRFADKDPVGKVVSDIIERALSFEVDTYDFDGMMNASIKDSEITDRGMARVRYLPQFAGEGENETVAYAEVTCEHVLWRDFRRGPGRFWGEVPWQAFRHFLSKDEVAKLIALPEGDTSEPVDIEQISFNYSTDGTEAKEKDAKADVFKRAMVWEIWDRDSKKVLFICQDYHDRVLKSEDDPLQLTKFFPTPKPLQAIEQTSSLVPVTPLRVYKDLVNELNEITKRITKLIKTLRPRGMYGGNALDVQAVGNADDGELVPATDVMAFLNNGGLEKAIHWYPLDPTTKAIQTLYEQRAAIEQTIYQVTGIADIQRGSTDPNETLGAQQLKAQWGSLRIQRRQSEVARFARELFEIKAEIIASKFDWPLLSKMTGIELPSQEQKATVQALMQQVQQAQQQGQEIPPHIAQQAEQAQQMLSQPSQEEVMALLQDDISRQYRIDIESDSTIRNDLTRNQQTMNLFLQGTAQFGAAMGPIIMADASMKPVIMEIYSSFARQFKLGRQAEDAIDAATEQAEQSAKQPPPPSPEQQKMEAEKQKQAADMQMAKEKHAMELEKMQLGLQIEKEKLQLKREEMEMKRQEMALDMQAHQQKTQMDAEAQQQKVAVQAQALDHKAIVDERTMSLQAEAGERKHELGLETMEAKAKAAKQKPKNGATK
jgi:hypothetical protein